MYTEWTKHLSDPKDKAEFERDILGSKRILDHLQGILELKEIALEKSELRLDSFDQPNWAYKQAFKNGYKSALTYLKELIDLDQQREIR